MSHPSISRDRDGANSQGGCQEEMLVVSPAPRKDHEQHVCGHAGYKGRVKGGDARSQKENEAARGGQVLREGSLSECEASSADLPTANALEAHLLRGLRAKNFID